MVAGRAVCKRANVAKLARLFATLGLGLGLIGFVGAGCVGFNLQDFLDQPGGQQPATDPVPTGRVPEAVEVTTLLINDAQVTADVHVLYLIQDQTVHEAYLALAASPGPGNTALVGPDEAAVVVVEGTFAAPPDEPLHKTAAETQSFGPLIYQAGVDFDDGDVLEIHLDLSEPPEREPPNEPPSISGIATAPFSARARPRARSIRRRSTKPPARTRSTWIPACWTSVCGTYTRSLMTANTRAARSADRFRSSTKHTGR